MYCLRVCYLPLMHSWDSGSWQLIFSCDFNITLSLRLYLHMPYCISTLSVLHHVINILLLLLFLLLLSSLLLLLFWLLFPLLFITTHVCSNATTCIIDLFYYYYIYFITTRIIVIYNYWIKLLYPLSFSFLSKCSIYYLLFNQLLIHNLLFRFCYLCLLHLLIVKLFHYGMFFLRLYVVGLKVARSSATLSIKSHDFKFYYWFILVHFVWKSFLVYLFTFVLSFLGICLVICLVSFILF